MSGLRTSRGVSFSRLRSFVTGSLENILDFKKIKQLEELGFLVVEEDRLWATRRGRDVLDSILPELYL